MRIAVLSDIHGNHIALNECLKHAKGQNVDRYVFLGDYLGEFPYQQKTMGGNGLLKNDRISEWKRAIFGMKYIILALKWL